MGLEEILKNAINGSKNSSGNNKPVICPSCGEKINLGMDRCPKCGVRIKSMFRIRCPRCQTLNEINIKHCIKCLYDFEAESERTKKTTYSCPICGYKMDTMLTSCPSCNTRFM